MRSDPQLFLRREIVGSVLSPLMLLLVPSFSSAQQKVVEQAPQARIESEFKIGSQVVLKASGTPLDANGKAVSIQDNLRIWIQGIDGERLLLIVSDVFKRGWIRRDQVVPYNKAMDFFDDEIARNPTNADAYWSRGRLWSDRGDSDRALADLDQAIRLQPDQARFHSMRGLVLYFKDQDERSMAESDRAIQLNAADVVAHMTRGYIWMSRRDHRRAHLEFDEAIRVAPTNADALYRRAACWDLEDRYDEAIKDMNEAIRLYPKNSSYLLTRGGLWEKRNESDKALADLNEAIKLDPNEPRAFYKRSSVWNQKHDREKELADISRAIQLQPSNPYYHIRRADVWAARGKHKEALADYDEAIRLRPDDAAPYVSRGVEWLKDAMVGGNVPDKAVDDFNRAIELDPNNTFAYYFRANAEERKRDYIGAIRDRSKLVAIDGGNAEAHDRLARLLATCPDAAIRDGARAIVEATRACEIAHWKDRDCLETLAAAYAEAGDFPAAIKWQSRAMEIASKKPLERPVGDFDMKKWLRKYQRNEPRRD